jgi:NAD+ synthase (glutamine-hydrolysing)
MILKYHNSNAVNRKCPSDLSMGYLRRSGARWFFLPLSGGADSTCVALIVSIIARVILKDVVNGSIAT